ncbi:MAG: hypothetical protein HIU84_10740 [Acidobacteria bacterium]|nr:hypothetical protein [Acidobacteriota bacterium]
MSPNPADNRSELFIDWGVTKIYGFPGVGIGALRRHEEQLAEPQLTS